MKPIPEPGPDAPPWAWTIYFDDQIRIINEDLRRERTSLDQELKKFRAAQRKKLSARPGAM